MSERERERERERDAALGIYDAVEEAICERPKGWHCRWWTKPRMTALRRAAMRGLTAPWLEEFGAVVAMA